MKTSLCTSLVPLPDGLPVLGIDVGGVGVSVPGESVRYVSLPAGANTVVARIASSGEIVYSRLVAGTFTIPAVAYDGSASGLSHDGKTLVLIEPRQSFPREETTLLVLNAKSLRPTRLLSLRGLLDLPDPVRLAQRSDALSRSCARHELGPL